MNGYDIGVLGGYGAVGAQLCTLLAAHDPNLTILVGGRDGARAKEFAAGVDGACEGTAVDLGTPSLADFCARSRVVVNCAGPSYRVLDTVARAALAAGAHYVDPGGDEPVLDRLAGVATDGRAVVLNAGMMPGLTGLLPRWLAAHGGGRPTRLTAYVGTMDRLTPAGAADYLLSLGGGHGDAGAAWRDGALAHRALAPLSEVELPFFAGRASAYPYLSRETGRIARLLGLRQVDWYNVFDGGAHMMKTLSRLQGAMVGEGDLARAADELTTAAALDLFGREPYQLMVLEMHGEADGSAWAHSAVLRGRDTYQLTAFLAAYAVREILAGRLPAGVHLAAEVLDPADVVDRLPGLPAVTGWTVYDQTSAAGVCEEGVL